MSTTPSRNRIVRPPGERDQEQPADADPVADAFKAMGWPLPDEPARPGRYRSPVLRDG